MSLIAHRCVACGHPDIFHEANATCSHGCCAAHAPVYGPPEVLRTFDGHGRPVTTIAEPGSAFRAFARGTVDLCGCQQCHALYQDRRDGAA